MEMDLANTLGDHSFVCAKHFQPEDVVMRNNTGRLSTTAVPSVFSNYPLQMPSHFFKTIYQTANDIVGLGEEEGQNEGIYVADVDPFQLNEMIRLPMSNTRHVTDSLSTTHQTTPSRNYTKSKSVILADGYKKKLQIVEARCRQLETRLDILEKKLKLYNINVLERDAENNNEEASFLLNMLKSYTVFENTRKEILTPQKDETIIKSNT